MSHFRNQIDLMYKYYNDNKKSIDAYNHEILPKTLIIACFVTFIPLIVSFFREGLEPARYAYLYAFLGLLLLYLLIKANYFHKKPVIFGYSFSLILYLLASYLSLFVYSDYPAGTMLIYLALIPLLFIDRSLRIDFSVFSLFAIHAALSFVFKGTQLGFVDLLNTFLGVTLGLLFGRLFLVSKLKHFETDRLLTIEKETDFLTGLFNRRKLYDDFTYLKVNQHYPIGLMMIDIDQFKKYNDIFGHNDGDACLSIFGRYLLELENKQAIKFYRYGGEEFIGVTKGITHAELFQYANKIKEEVQSLKLTSGTITISIGLSICKGSCDKQIDYFINEADQALYRAKEKGRNRVEF